MTNPLEYDFKKSLSSLEAQVDRDRGPSLLVLLSLHHSPYVLVIMNMMLRNLLNCLYNYIPKIVS